MHFVDYFCPSIVLILIGLVFLIRFIFSKRYGQLLATKILTMVFGISFLIAFITFEVISRAINGQASPTTDWQQYMKIQTPITKLEYRPGSGLYAFQDINDVQVTDDNPFCISDGQLANLKPREIQVANSQLSELSSPPQTAIQQVNFILLYPIAADEIAFSSFAVFESGEVWCTERYMRGGLGGAVAVGFVGFTYVVISALGFVGSFILLLILSIIDLEIHRRRKDSSSE